MDRSTTDVAFTPAVKAQQQRWGSRRGYAALESRGGWESEIDADLAAFIESRDSFFLATASADGQPYMQHRGGAAGFLHVAGPRTLAFADYRGNKQFISVGNLTENPRAMLFLIDYVAQQRVKIWGKARVVEDPAEVSKLLRAGDPKADRAIVFEVEAWDVNCPQHIPRMVPVTAS
jgi:predicted pyridoxine 5'-phosphate oxidase superfamily flavin-nucleotide-binding protein